MVLPPPWHRQRSLGLRLSQRHTCSWCASRSHPHWIASTVYAVGHTSSALVHISIERLRSRRRETGLSSECYILFRNAQGFVITSR